MAWCVAYIDRGEEEFIWVLLVKPEGKNHLEKLGIVGRIMLKRIL
jgi:hypothetical protein